MGLLYLRAEKYAILGGRDMKTCMCLKCKKQYKPKEIGIKLVDSGWGVCPECGGRISRTDNPTLIPLLEELGEKNCAILHSFYSKPENYEYKGKKIKSKPFIFFHILVKNEDELIMLVLAKSVPLKEISRYRLSGNGKKMVYCNELVKELADHFGCNFALDTHFYFECVESAILSGNPVIIVKNQ